MSFYASYQKIIKNTRWCPPVISWFINPMNTIVISIINPSYCSYLHQLNANYGAPPCIVVIIVSGCGPFGSFHCQTRPDGPARISPLSFYASYQKIIKNTRWCPPVISWFINPMNTIVISIINPSYCSYLHQLNANELGHHLVSLFLLSPDAVHSDHFIARLGQMDRRGFHR